MQYTRLLLDDFGIFQRAELNDIEPGLTVVAGPQRAGKTTFMQALRRVGYGITQGDDLPGASDTYRLTAELTHEDDDYRLNVEGYSEPTLSPLDWNDDTAELSVADIFGSLSEEQYRQLHTLSLDQLQRLPPTIDDPEDLSRVLLGAAYGSIAELPEIKGIFAEHAHDIGRKRGHPRYGQFSDAYEQVEEGQDALEAANDQIEEYDSTQAELDEVEAELHSLGAERDQLEREKQRLTVLQQHYDDFHRYRRLGEELEAFSVERQAAYPEKGLDRAEGLLTEFERVSEEREEAKSEFDAETTATDLASQREDLLAVSDELRSYQNEISGWRERLQSVRDGRAELDETEADLRNRIEQLRAGWSGEFEEVKRIDVDVISRDAVEQAVSDASDAKENLTEVETELQAKRERRSEVSEQLEAAEAEGGNQRGLAIATGGGIAGVVAAIGVGSAVGTVAGVAVGAVLVLVAAGVGLQQSGSGGSGSQRTQLQAQLNSLDQEIAELEEQYDHAQSELERAEAELETIRDQLDLSGDLSPAGIRRFYDAVVDLHSEIDSFEVEKSQYQEESDTLVEELQTAAEITEPVHSFEWDQDKLLENAEGLFTAIEQAAKEVDLAQEWENARTAQADVAQDVQALIDEWDSGPELTVDQTKSGSQALRDALEQTIAEGEQLAEADEYREERQAFEKELQARFGVDAVREAFAAAYDPDSDSEIEDWSLDAFAAVADSYAGPNELESRIDEIDERLDEIQRERESLQKRQVELQQELDDLASEDDLIEARREIQDGSKTIAQLGEEYATHRLAEHITERLQERFIEETTGPLLDEASEIFQRITAEYSGIEHTGELDALDFQVMQNGEGTLDRTELSRATAEQLFMSVRLARIRQLDASLPIVIDDALTNFDPGHSARTMRLIDEMASTNQVFFLTAHPSFVELAAEYADVAQYWRLTDGRFDGPFDESGPALSDLEERIQSVS